MARFRVIHKDNLVTVRQKKMGSFKYNMQDVDIFGKNLVDGVFKIEIHKVNEVYYSGPESIPLKTYFNKGIDKLKMYSVFAQLLNIEAKIKSLSLNTYNVMLDENYIFVTEPAGRVFVIYEPLYNNSTGTDLCKFYAEYLSKIKPRDLRVIGDMQYLISYLREPVYKDTNTLTKFIEKSCPEVYKRMPKPGSGMSNYLAPDMTEYQNHYGSTNDFNHPSQNIYGQNAQNYYAQFMPQNGMQNNFQSAPQNFQQSGFSNNMPGGDDGGTTLLMPNDEEEGTTLLTNDAPGFAPRPLAFLTRQSNGQSFEITSPETTVGKSADNMISIPDNNTISRHHGKLVCAQGGFEFIDLGSSNHSYLNGELIQPNSPVKLMSGMMLRLSNEDFLFTIES